MLQLWLADEDLGYSYPGPPRAIPVPAGTNVLVKWLDIKSNIIAFKDSQIAEKTSPSSEIAIKHFKGGSP